jgi:hypothetical protein
VAAGIQGGNYTPLLRPPQDGHRLTQLATDQKLLNLTAAIGNRLISPPWFLMPEVVCPSKMSHERQNRDEQRHEKKVLSDHDALLFAIPLAEPSIAIFPK